VLLAAYLALSCIACAQEPPSLAQSGREAVVFWRLSAYKGTGLQRPTQQVVTDEQEFWVLWEQIFTNSPPQVLPAVDFSREAVIVVGLGGRSDGAERLQIDAILRRRVWAGGSVDHHDRRQRVCGDTVPHRTRRSRSNCGDSPPDHFYDAYPYAGLHLSQ